MGEILNRKFGIFIAAIGVVGLLAALIAVLLFSSKFSPPLSSDPGDWGTFGDYLGGTLNPIFGFFSLLALLLALWLQSRELSLTRDEIRASRIAAEESAQAQRATQSAIEEQTLLQARQIELGIAQLEVQKLNAQIQAIELESRGYNPGAAERFAKQAQAVVHDMGNVIYKLKQSRGAA